jgi:hypothetical protein
MLARLVSDYGDRYNKELRIVGKGSHFIDQLIKYTLIMKEFKLEPLNTTTFEEFLRTELTSVVYRYQGSPPFDLKLNWSTIVCKEPCLIPSTREAVHWQHNGYAVSETDIIDSNFCKYYGTIGRHAVVFHVQSPPGLSSLLSDNLDKKENDIIINNVLEKLTSELMDFVDKGLADLNQSFNWGRPPMKNYDPLSPNIDNVWDWVAAESSKLS